MVRCVLIGMGIGVLTEGAARIFKLWLYGQPQTAILNIVAMFGLIMGGIAAALPRIGLWPAFGAAATIGLLYEVANLRFLHWWHFPGERLLFIRGQHAIVLVLALLWGVVPILTATVHATAKRTGFSISLEDRLEQMNTQERQLLDALEAVRQRERNIQARLDGLRQKKQALLDRQAIRKPRAAQPPPTAN